MMARCSFVLAMMGLLFSSGCCCLTGPCGGPCCGICLPRPIVWDGGCNECGPGPCESCGDCCPPCGLFPWLRRSLTCGKGCGEIYINEWISDPPDCCDPCDKCYGQFTGPHGYCCLGPAQRILAAFHGYRYCSPPNCGPSCGRPCACGHAVGHAVGYSHHGGGCATCGGGMSHGVEYAEGPVTMAPAPHGAPLPHGHSILEENWDTPKTTPEPGKPIHNAQQPPKAQMTRMAQPPRPGMRTASRGPRNLPMGQPEPFPGYGVRQAGMRSSPQAVENAPRRAAQWDGNE